MNKIILMLTLFASIFITSCEVSSEEITINIIGEAPTLRNNGVPINVGDITGYNFRYTIYDNFLTVSEGVTNVPNDIPEANIIIHSLVPGVSYTGSFEMQVLGSAGEESPWSYTMTKIFIVKSVANFLAPTIISVDMRGCTPVCVVSSESP